MTNIRLNCMLECQRETMKYHYHSDDSMRYLAVISICTRCGYEALLIDNISKICFSFISVNFKRYVIFYTFTT